MESNFSNRDFEQYVKQNADQYRMFPSDKVWRGVNNALHTRRKWYGFWLSFLLLLTGGAVTWVMTSSPASNEQDVTTSKSIRPSAASVETKMATDKEADGGIESLLPFTKQRITAENLPLIQNELSNVEPSLLPVQDIGEIQRPVISTQHFPSNGAGGEHFSLINEFTTNSNAPAEEVLLIDDQKIKVEAENSTASNDKIQAKHGQDVFYPMTIESVINSFRFTKTPKKISWQLFVTPTVSYRKLSVNKSSDNLPAINYP
ncbi:MAG: hypothetical protein E6H08_17755, partial [Bacteroidetes bacterium]